MPALYITEPGATLRLRGRSFLVTDRDDAGGPDKQLLEVEPHTVDLIALVGAVHVTADALRHCFAHGIPLAWFDREHDLQGRCVPPGDRNGGLRLAQFEAATGVERTATIARAIIGAKIDNSLGLLIDAQGNTPDNALLPVAIAALKDTRARLAAAPTLDVLRGLEGAAASSFFAAFGSALRPGTGMSFTRRLRRPPPDPVNALLSFASVLLGNRLASLLEARGLDPSIGFLHELRSGRPSLALDLLEEWRAPVVERFVLRACNLRTLRPEHFEADESGQGVRLTRDGLRSFFTEWEKFLLRPLRGADGTDRAVMPAMAAQVDALAKALLERSAYVPFVAR
ncbi:MAG: CRISPR-associated endonuclease Cas1 [Planctomycetes bacterium]|nr:CRISPR-associated endonuclease Cas1 [Planctomycetota bacterium]